MLTSSVYASLLLVSVLDAHATLLSAVYRTRLPSSCTDRKLQIVVHRHATLLPEISPFCSPLVAVLPEQLAANRLEYCVQNAFVDTLDVMTKHK